MRTLSLSVLLLLSSGIVSQVQEHQATAGHQTTDAPGLLWVPGFNGDGTVQQLILDSSLLVPMVGKTITALSFRRDVAGTDALLGGTASFEVHISSSRTTVRAPSDELALNSGSNRSKVFSGPVQLPHSPPYVGGSLWSPSNTVRVPFSSGFAYGGGSLCLEFASASANSFVQKAWIVDAVYRQVTGSSVSVCDSVSRVNAYTGGPGGFRETSGALGATLLAGGTGVFFAEGSAYGNAMFFIGVRFLPQPLNLAMLNSPQSNLWVDPIATVLTSFGPLPYPDPKLFGGEAVVDILLPADPSVFGATLVSQWIEYDLSVPEFLTSNAVRAQMASSFPSVMMSLIAFYKEPNGMLSAKGRVSVGMGHVIKFEYQ